MSERHIHDNASRIIRHPDGACPDCLARESALAAARAEGIEAGREQALAPLKELLAHIESQRDTLPDDADEMMFMAEAFDAITAAIRTRTGRPKP